MTTGNNVIFKPDSKNAIHDGIEHEPGGGKALLNLQSGLFQNAKDVEVAQLRANVMARDPVSQAAGDVP